jgi:hypothetical protein
MKATIDVVLLCVSDWTQGKAPRPEDVATVDGVVKAYYEVVSGPAGQPRDWDRDRTLHVPGVKFVAMGEKDRKPVAEVMIHEQHVARTSDWLVKNGFFEQEAQREMRRFGNIAHVWSTYESRQKPDGPVIGRGINSLDLYWDGTRWWVAAAVWDSERKDNPIAKEYLP